MKYTTDRLRTVGKPINSPPLVVAMAVVCAFKFVRNSKAPEFCSGKFYFKDAHILCENRKLLRRGPRGKEIYHFTRKTSKFLKYTRVSFVLHIQYLTT